MLQQLANPMATTQTATETETDTGRKIEENPVPEAPESPVLPPAKEFTTPAPETLPQRAQPCTAPDWPAPAEHPERAPHWNPDPLPDYERPKRGC